MSRRSDPFWSYVEKTAGGFWKCVFCGIELAESTSISRIKYHLARVKGGGVKLCEKVTPDVQRAAFDQLPNRMHGSMPSSSNNIIGTAGSDRAQDLEMQGQPLLDDELSSWMDSLIGGEILLTDENVAPGMPMPDAPETGLGTEPADQPFEMDMNNISSSLMRDVEFRSGTEKMTWELMQSVVERGSSSKRPVDRSVPSSSNNEATNAASTPVRGLATGQEEQPLLDSLIWGENLVTNAASTPVRGLAIGGETGLVEEPRAPVVLMTNEPRTEQAHQSSMMDTFFRMCRKIMSREYKHSVVERGSSSKSPAHKRRRTRRYVLPTTKLVGQAFERNMKDVWSWLLNDEVSCIGIYGMGGVGKTALATHIHNRLHHVCQERQDIFLHVCWITVSQDFSIEALQDCIANYFDLDLGDQKDAVVRAGMLLTELSVKKKYVLILDDLWDHFPLEKVGIPLRTDGCKLIFTTRSLDICKKMDCQRIIKVEPLSEGEAWNLFVEKLGHGARLFPETKQIVAESIVKECAGLPLGIMTMAGSMKGVKAEYRWRDALQRLRIPEVGPSDMETEVFRALKFSYAQLNDPALQKCFLHITIFPKGKIIWREDLIEYLIDEGIIVEMWRRHEQFDRGHTMLDQLENASLLEGSRDDENYRYVKMHDLIWDMARKILNESLGGRVQAGAQLTELPDGTWWRENLLIVSLMENRIKEIPSGFSPRCPNLSTLLLCRNYKLNLVESSFFQHFIRLQVLDLSDTDIEKLPDSICHLTTLTVLLLGWCAKLIYVPSLAKLKALEKLDLSYTGLENLPEGMERLKDLRYLNLDGSGVRDLQPGILPELSKLQFLKLHQKFGVFLPVRGREVVRLRKLETLECNFSDLENFGIFHIAGFLPLIACKVTVGRPSFSLLEDLNYTKSKSEAWFYDLMIDDASFLSRFSFPKLVIVNCQNIRSLCSWGGNGSLEILHLDGLMILETLFEAPSDRLAFSIVCSEGLTSSMRISCSLCSLKEIVIHKCHKMKMLFPPRLLSGLQLEVIVVEDCHNMGVIMGTDEEDRTHHIVTSENLKVLVLKKLPELNSIYCGRLECQSIEEIIVNDCPQLTRIPLTIPHSLKKIQVDPGIWWDCD
ncbi:disease resistance protein [Salix suchowensis]|nr:disease resistance protein [Salix suchowensis]